MASLTALDIIVLTLVGGSAILLAVLGDGAWQARTTLAVLGGLWGARLALHLWHRVRSEPEDGRYRYLREPWQGRKNLKAELLGIEADRVRVASVQGEHEFALAEIDRARLVPQFDGFGGKKQ